KAIENLNEPSEILNVTRNIIIERLKKDGSAEGGKDGMDCSLCVYDFNNNQLRMALANNPVWIIRGEEIIEIKPDKMPVGKHDKQDIPFTTQSIQLQKGDVIYTLTDGFPDQFGGEKGKKFMSKNLRELLAKNAHLPMQEQKQLLETTFRNWVGDLEQVDDVTVIGVRV
ncbi:MAG: PP2C family protein-serine/threonine phosphatase, partial [Bacteroidota bacterium]